MLQQPRPSAPFPRVGTGQEGLEQVLLDGVAVLLDRPLRVPPGCLPPPQASASVFMWV